MCRDRSPTRSIEGHVARAAQARPPGHEGRGRAAAAPSRKRSRPRSRRAKAEEQQRAATRPPRPQQREREARLAAAKDAKPAEAAAATEAPTADERAETAEPRRRPSDAATDRDHEESDRWLTITAKDVAALRKATGAGMMDCKKALEETDGDLEAAKDWLREQGPRRRGEARRPRGRPGRGRGARRGQRRRARRAQLRDRLRRQGRRLQRAPSPTLAQLVVEQGDADARRARRSRARTVGEHVTQLAAKLGENVALGRVVALRDDRRPARRLQAHPERARHHRRARRARRRRPGRRARPSEVAHDIALHIASRRAPLRHAATTCPPTWSSRSAPSSRSRPATRASPSRRCPKIVEGRLNGFYKDDRARSSRRS